MRCSQKGSSAGRQKDVLEVSLPSIYRERRQEIPRVLVNPLLGHHSSPVCYISIVPPKVGCARSGAGEGGSSATARTHPVRSMQQSLVHGRNGDREKTYGPSVGDEKTQRRPRRIHHGSHVGHRDRRPRRNVFSQGHVGSSNANGNRRAGIQGIKREV